MSTPPLFVSTAPSGPGRDLVASTRPRADWLSIPDTLPPEPEAAAWWVRKGQQEHAALAHTSRLALELVSIGAPATLVLAVQRAAMEQVEHAKLCFGLAAAFGAGPVGPGTLDVSDVFADGVDLVTVARRLVADVCVAESLAAMEMAEAAAHAVDPGLREALGVLAADGRRHGELGWRCLRWLLACGGGALRREVSLALERALDAVESEPVVGGIGLVGYGILPPLLRYEVRQEGRHAVLAEVASDLLDPFEMAMAVDLIAS